MPVYTLHECTDCGKETRNYYRYARQQPTKTSGGLRTVREFPAYRCADCHERRIARITREDNEMPRTMRTRH